MIIAPPTADEEARLALLKALQLLDSPPEEVFDRITRLAALALDMPIVLISLIDRDRQWFKSRVGLDASETPRDLAFCAHAIRQHDPLVINDATQDPRFADNPLVVGEPKIRFYAGAPILTHNGIALGTLCVIDRKPRELSPAQLRVLMDCCELVRREILQRETSLLTSTVVDANVRQLASSEMRFEAIFEQAAVGIALLNLNGEYLRANPKLCAITGFSEAELRGQPFQNGYHLDDLYLDAEQFVQLSRGEIRNYSTEKRFYHRDGSTVWFNLTAAALRIEEGEQHNYIAVIEDISARKATELHLNELRKQLELSIDERTRELTSVIEKTQDAYLVVENGIIEEWNPSAEVLFGWSRAEAIGRPLAETILPPSMRGGNHAIPEKLDADDISALTSQRFEVTMLRRDGTHILCEANMSPLPSKSGRRFANFLRDITERKQAEETLKSNREQIKAIANNIPICVAHIDRNLIVRFANEAFRTLTNRSPEEVLGMPMSGIAPSDVFLKSQPFLERVLKGERVTFEISTAQTVVDGAVLEQPLYFSTTYVPEIQGDRVEGLYMMVQDISAQKQLQLSLQKDATIDELTGLQNRRALLAELPRVVSRAHRSGLPFAILFLDLDGFKAINDNYGHATGDKVLAGFAGQLRKCVRKNDMVSRLSGDEFILILEGLRRDALDAEHVGQKLQIAMRKPLMIGDTPISIGVSIGIQIFPADLELPAEELIASADRAMYQAKRHGKSRIWLNASA